MAALRSDVCLEVGDHICEGHVKVFRLLEDFGGVISF